MKKLEWSNLLKNVKIPTPEELELMEKRTNEKYLKRLEVFNLIPVQDKIKITELLLSKYDIYSDDTKQLINHILMDFFTIPTIY